MEKKCEYCGGDLEYVALPKTVTVDKPSRDYATIRVCKQCGRPHEPDIDKEDLPFLDEVRK